MSELRVAVPADPEQGLDSPISGHFGHSPGFIVATITNGTIQSFEPLQNVPHSSCAGPVDLLTKHGVNILLTRGMGMRPLAYSQQTGLTVVIAEGVTVREVFDNFIRGNQTPMGMEHTCRGGRAH